MTYVKKKLPEITETLPSFRSHPGPMETGRVIRSGAVCDVCQRTRGTIYYGPIKSDLNEISICPWCIADGSAKQEFEIEFFSSWDIPVNDLKIVEEVCARTPDYISLQGEHWFTHCNDAIVYMGQMPVDGLLRVEPKAVKAFEKEPTFGGGSFRSDNLASRIYELNQLTTNNGPQAYLFQCLHCGIYTTFLDMD